MIHNTIAHKYLSDARQQKQHYFTQHKKTGETTV